jgi:hypothetical protein
MTEPADEFIRRVSRETNVMAWRIEALEKALMAVPTRVELQRDYVSREEAGQGKGNSREDKLVRLVGGSLIVSVLGLAVNIVPKLQL